MEQITTNNTAQSAVSLVIRILAVVACKLFKDIPFDIFPTRCNTTQFIYFSKTALRVSDGISTHHQEHTRLYLQHLVLSKPLLLPAAIVEELELRSNSSTIRKLKIPEQKSINSVTYDPRVRKWLKSINCVINSRCISIRYKKGNKTFLPYVNRV